MLLAAIALLFALTFQSLAYMATLWSTQEEYGYAYLLPAIAIFMVWQKRDTLQRLRFEGSWAGLTIVLVGLGMAVLGELSTLYIVVQYAFLVVLAGLALALMGWTGFRKIWAPLVLLGFAIPLPNFLYQNLSAQLQLVSSQLGVAIIRLFGITVSLDGNVIDLGSYKLQVVEACNGLRYLFPLMALGFIAAYLFKGALWKRIVIFLSTVPITIFMNSFRIGTIGVMVEYWGRNMAEGFLHDFEGWVIFMFCMAILVGEMWILARIGRDRKSLAEAFGLELPSRLAAGTRVWQRAIPKPFTGALVVIAIVVVCAAALPTRVEAPLERKDFAQFPMTLDQWKGTPGRLESHYLDVLKLSDYLIADFVATDKRVAREKRPVNFYVAYYASQRRGESAHSPRSCIPGDGWEITSLTERVVPTASSENPPLRVNRALIQKGDNRQLVYYWFQQRGRVLTNEYLVKWYLFWDALTRNRTDGALVRLITPVGTSESLENADLQLSLFAGRVAGDLPAFIPD